jgi:hypothetical protein
MRWLRIPSQNILTLGLWSDKYGRFYDEFVTSHAKDMQGSGVSITRSSNAKAKMRELTLLLLLSLK